MAKLPQYTARVPSGIGRAGKERIGDFGALTDTGKRAVTAAKSTASQVKMGAEQAKIGAIGKVGDVLGQAAGMAFQAYQHRHAIETNQQVTAAKNDMARWDINVLRSVKDSVVDSEVGKENLHGSIMAEREKHAKEVIDKYRELNKDTVRILEEDLPREILLFDEKLYEDLGDSHRDYMVANYETNTKEKIEVYVAEEDEDKAEVILKDIQDDFDSYVKHGLRTQEQANDDFARWLTEAMAMRILRETKNLSEATKYVMESSIDTDIKEGIVRNLNFEAKTIEDQFDRNEEEFYLRLAKEEMVDEDELNQALATGQITMEAHKRLTKIIKERKFPEIDDPRARGRVLEAINALGTETMIKKDVLEVYYEAFSKLTPATQKSLHIDIYAEQSRADARGTVQANNQMGRMIGKFDEIAQTTLFSDEKQAIGYAKAVNELSDLIKEAQKKDKSLTGREKMVEAVRIAKAVNREIKAGKQVGAEHPVTGYVSMGLQPSGFVGIEEPETEDEFYATVKSIEDEEKARAYYERWKDKW